MVALLYISIDICISAYRKVSELQNSSQTLRLFVVHSALLLSSVYSARILEEFHLIHHTSLLVTHLKIHFTDFLQYYLHYIGFIQVALPLRDRKVVSLYDKIYHPQLTYIDFIVRTHHLDLLSRLLAYYLVLILLLRNGWHSTSRRDSAYIQSCLSSFYQLGTSIFVLHVNFL